MTGYGRAVETVNGREFTVELRSVNNRYLDCTVKMPRSLSFAEEAVKQAVKQAVSRGKVDVYISVKSETADDTKITLNTAVLEGYLAAMRQMVTDFGVKDDISVSTVSRLPEVFSVEKPEVDEEQLKADLLSVVAKALAGYNAMRETEGKALDADLRNRGNTILEFVSKVEAGNGQTVIDYRTRLENKLKEVLANTSIDEGRILTEDLSLYNTANVVFQPKHMTPEELLEGYLWMYRQIYSFRSILRRMPEKPDQRAAYLMFNLLYRKFGRFSDWLCRRIGYDRIGWLGEKLSRYL